MSSVLLMQIVCLILCALIAAQSLRLALHPASSPEWTSIITGDTAKGRLTEHWNTQIRIPMIDQLPVSYVFLLKESRACVY